MNFRHDRSSIRHTVISVRYAMTSRCSFIIENACFLCEAQAEAEERVKH